MEELKKLLGRFKNVLDQDSEKRQLVVASVKTACHFDINPEDISIKGTILRLDVSPAKKSELKLHEREVLELLAKGNLRIDQLL